MYPSRDGGPALFNAAIQALCSRIDLTIYGHHFRLADQEFEDCGWWNAIENSQIKIRLKTHRLGWSLISCIATSGHWPPCPALCETKMNQTPIVASELRSAETHIHTRKLCGPWATRPTDSPSSLMTSTSLFVATVYPTQGTNKNMSVT